MQRVIQRRVYCFCFMATYSRANGNLHIFIAKKKNDYEIGMYTIWNTQRARCRCKVAARHAENRNTYTIPLTVRSIVINQDQ